MYAELAFILFDYACERIDYRTAEASLRDRLTNAAAHAAIAGVLYEIREHELSISLGVRRLIAAERT